MARSGSGGVGFARYDGDHHRLVAVVCPPALGAKVSGLMPTSLATGTQRKIAVAVSPLWLVTWASGSIGGRGRSRQGTVG